MPTETELRAEMIRVARLMHAHEFVDGTAGNLSVRLEPDRFLVTPSGLAKGFMTPEQLLVVDGAGRVVRTAPGMQPTSEILMHLEAYRRRPDVQAVIHAHPITSVALSIAGISLAECVVPEAVVVLGLTPTLPYATPSSAENQRAIAGVIDSHDALILQYHGTLTVGRDLHEAYLRLETLEHTAKIVALAKLLGGGPALPPEQALKLLQSRQEMGFARPNDAEEFCLACGVCHDHGQHRPQPRPVTWDDQALNAEEQLVREIVARVQRELQNGAGR